MTYHIGQIVPFAYSRGIWAYDLAAPRWHIFRVPSTREDSAEKWLMRNGATEAWHPAEKTWRETTGRHRKKVPVFVPIVPGWTFVQFDREPHWDVLRERSCGKLLQVVSNDGVPMAIPEAVIERMTDVPRLLHERRLALAEARRIRVGDRATLDPGSALAWTVEVTAIEGPFARIVTPLLGGRESLVDAARLERMMD